MKLALQLFTIVHLSFLLDIAHTTLVFKGFVIYVIMLSGKQKIKSPANVVKVVRVLIIIN